MGGARGCGVPARGLHAAAFCFPALGPPPQMKKGNTMQQFLQKALEILRKDFSELRSGRGVGGSGTESPRGRALPGAPRLTAPVAGGQGGRATRRRCAPRGGRPLLSFARRRRGPGRPGASTPSCLSSVRSAGVEQLMYIKEDLIIPHVSPFSSLQPWAGRPRDGRWAPGALVPARVSGLGRWGRRGSLCLRRAVGGGRRAGAAEVGPQPPLSCPLRLAPQLL